MDKSDAISLLIAKGYNASLNDGMVIIESPDRKDFERGKKILKKAGYNQSFGWKLNNSPEADANDEADGLCGRYCEAVGAVKQSGTA